MLLGARLRGACPKCRAHILRTCDLTALEGLRHSAPLAHRSPALPTAPTHRQRSQVSRPFSSTAKRREPATTDENIKPTAAEIEATVRQAKQDFGNTLPHDYLSKAEYKVYERLYGAPLRVTQPQDVGIDFEEPIVGAEDSSKNALLRENEDGVLEEVEYGVEEDLDEGSEETFSQDEADADAEADEEGMMESSPTKDAIPAQVTNQRQYDALLQLQKDFEAAQAKAARKASEEDDVDEEHDEDKEQDEQEDDEADAVFEEVSDYESPRMHPYTIEGQWRTSPSTIELPRYTLIEPITDLISRTDKAHIQKCAENKFGGPALPYSPATPKSTFKTLQKPVMMEATGRKMTEIEADTYLTTVIPGIYASTYGVLTEVRKRLGPQWIRGLLSRRDNNSEGPRVLDVGGGGAALAAWEEILGAEWKMLQDDGEVSHRNAPPGRKTVVVGSDNLRHRLSKFLQNTTFLPRVPDYLHSASHTEDSIMGTDVPATKKTFDIILATHMLMPLDKQFRRKELIDNLWQMLSPDGGILIVLEKGHPRGFEMVADVRDRVLKEFIIPPGQKSVSNDADLDNPDKMKREPGMIIAPCTNHTKCPMYLAAGQSAGRKDFCHFSQRFARPIFLQRLHGLSHRNHEDIDFSYLAVRRGIPPSYSDCHLLRNLAPPNRPVEPTLHGEQATKAALVGHQETTSTDSPTTTTNTTQQPPPQQQQQQPDLFHPLSLPRNVLPPIKRKGHVTLDLCTPSGTIERWTIPRSFSKQAYHDARKAKWGDLWALGAKTRVQRAVRLGRAFARADGSVRPTAADAAEIAAAAVTPAMDGGVRARAAASAGKRPKVKNVNVGPDSTGRIVQSVAGRGRVAGAPERRTKGGRKPNPREMKRLMDEFTRQQGGMD